MPQIPVHRELQIGTGQSFASFSVDPSFAKNVQLHTASGAHEVARGRKKQGQGDEIRG